MTYLSLTLPGGQTINPGTGLPTGGLTTVVKVIANALTLLLILVTILTLVYLIWGGINWTTSGGDKSKVAQARAKITYAIIGLIIAFISFGLLSLFGYFFGVNLLSIG